MLEQEDSILEIILLAILQQVFNEQEQSLSIDLMLNRRSNCQVLEKHTKLFQQLILG